MGMRIKRRIPDWRIGLGLVLLALPLWLPPTSKHLMRYVDMLRLPGLETCTESGTPVYVYLRYDHDMDAVVADGSRLSLGDNYAKAASASFFDFQLIYVADRHPEHHFLYKYNDWSDGRTTCRLVIFAD
ncbi:MAG: hypothetical protein KDE09_08465 [Anaerolineales bacterium]|nr:hypothetical protein [Anaerolineales bacterium]